MYFKKTGKLTDFFHVVGNRHFPTHLLLSQKPVLFEAGVACLGPVYVLEISRISGSVKPEILFLTHVHYDHCGTAGFLKQAFPGLQIAASRRAAEIVQRPNAIKAMRQLNRQTRNWLEAESPGMPADVTFEAFEVDLILSDGDRLKIGDDVTVEVIETPGHTWDGLSFYVPEKKLLVAGESAGCMSPAGFLYTEFLVDFEAYVDSIRRLAALEVEILCQSHHQVITGEDAASFFSRSLRAARDYKRRVDELLDEENGDQQKVAVRIKAEEYDPMPSPKQPEQAYMINLTARVKHLAARRT